MSATLTLYRNLRCIISILTSSAIVCTAQPLAPKQAYPFTVKQIHSGHSLTDPLFYPHWPGQYVNLVASVTQQSSWQLVNRLIGKSTAPGSQMSYRWENPPGYDAPDARHDILNWELLSITERVPLLYEGGSTQQWYKNGIIAQRNALSLFVNNAWTQGNGGKGAATLLWTTWVHVDGSSGNFRSMLDVQGQEWERMQDLANQKRPAGAPPVYLIPGHKMMARLHDDIAKGIVPGITNITQFFSDQIHTNELGAYAIAMIHYACIFNRSPLGLPHRLIPNAPSGTPMPTPELATYLQNMVWDVVTSYDRTGISASTSVQEGQAKLGIILSPQPANDVLTVTCKSPATQIGTIHIHDIAGCLVAQAEVSQGASTAHINVQHLPAGVYVLTIADPLGVESTTWLKVE